jgi:hypothetical protein
MQSCSKSRTRTASPEVAFVSSFATPGPQRSRDGEYKDDYRMSTIAMLRLSHLHRRGLIRGLARPGIEGREGQFVGGDVVHGNKNLA